MNISILGAGNAGCAHAAMFTLRGHDVTLIKTSNSLHDENYNIIKENNGIFLSHKNITNQFVPLKSITRNIKNGIQDADLIIIMTQTLYHHDVSEKIKEHITDRTKYIMSIPGYLGSLHYINLENVILIEGESTPYDARITSPGHIQILFENIRNAIGVYPGKYKEDALKLCQELTPAYHKTRSNIIESALHNPNLVVHTIGAIMSAPRIEYSKGEFWMYKEAFTPAIWNLIEELDNEKNKVISHYHGIPSPYVEECKYRNEVDLSQDAKQVFEMYAATGGPKGPEDINSRYIYEDVPKGLVLLETLARIANIPTPLATSLIEISSLLLSKDFRKDNQEELSNFINSITNKNIFNKLVG
ncbi:NAD/NADP octopine/nopaline dehydrogenase family protein [Providencia stuartii]|uniref:NAD/NADP octopine/nopaline dehydrogenase family protein n=1 Tax=Providencia stuartii TaxID=588 RepID=UPI0018C7F5D5|nr:NAD/NADP octopine/nopaline dehydrogenase family protein [Providencia stuartii]MBG5921220.1 NAD/NADP octopine/nopaline dehydrogenase family protein [Providencia stuartii]